MFGTNYVLWWSPDATKVAFIRSDETAVDIFYLTKYGLDAYPTQIPVKYPKPGYTNPTAELLIFDIASGVTGPVDFAVEGEFLIVQVAWIDTSAVAARLTNRVQSLSQLYRVNADSLTADMISSQSAPAGWIEYVRIPPNIWSVDFWKQLFHFLLCFFFFLLLLLLFLSFFFSLLLLQSELLLIPGSLEYIELVDYQGYNHIALYNYLSPTPTRMVTQGNWEVTQIAGFRPDLRTA